MSGEIPPISDADLHQAFEGMGWNGWTFAAAMADPFRSRVLKARASDLRTKRWLKSQRRTVVPVKRVRLGVDGHPVGWATQLVMGDLEPIRQGSLIDV